MRILYAIQGTGNGHIARAEEIIPHLSHYGEIDIFISGTQADIQLPFPVQLKSKGLSFYFGKKGGIDILKTIRNTNIRRVFREIRDFPVADYDLVINDFEAISAWACKRQDIPCLALSHQFALTSKRVPRPTHTDSIGSWFLANYAPVENGIGFHFSSWDKYIMTPVIRSRVRQLPATDKGHYTVYLPAYSDQKIMDVLRMFPGIPWQVFSKHSKKSYQRSNVTIVPVNNEAFTQSMASARGVLCGAGFETPAEALYLRKKLMVIPMKNQYEQHYNAAGLNALGVPVIPKLSEKYKEVLSHWLESAGTVQVDYQDNVSSALERLIRLYKSNY